MTRPHYLTPTKASMAKKKEQTPSAPRTSVFTTPTSSTASTHAGLPSANTAPVSSWASSPLPSMKYSPPRRSVIPSASPHYLTPTRKSHLKSSTPSRSTTPKLLYLIRHGESMGQAANRLGMDRRRDERLRDASLTKYGIWQAEQLTEYEFPTPIDLIVSSPLTRALHTALLGFRSHRSSTPSLLIHYDLAELGSRVPENMPRSIEQVLQDLGHDGTDVDSTSLKPPTWPNISYDSKLNRTNAIRRAMQYLHEDREEQCIAVVCHHNVIREILEDNSVRPENADPIVCELRPNGKVVTNGMQIE